VCVRVCAINRDTARAGCVKIDCVRLRESVSVYVWLSICTRVSVCMYVCVCTRTPTHASACVCGRKAQCTRHAWERVCVFWCVAVCLCLFVVGLLFVCYL